MKMPPKTLIFLCQDLSAAHLKVCFNLVQVFGLAKVTNILRTYKHILYILDVLYIYIGWHFIIILTLKKSFAILPDSVHL